MDISETYIKVCEKAWEIQAIKLTAFSKDFEVGDYYLYRGAVEQGEEIELAVSLWKRPQSSVWLPRQDQLQILSGLSWYLFDKTCVTWATTNPDYQRESKEIVGLRVVMHTVHNKQWGGNEWILDKIWSGADWVKE